MGAYYFTMYVYAYSVLRTDIWSPSSLPEAGSCMHTSYTPLEQDNMQKDSEPSVMSCVLCCLRIIPLGTFFLSHFSYDHMLDDETPYKYIVYYDDTWDDSNATIQSQ